MKALSILFIALLLTASCKKDKAPEGMDLKQEMRNFVENISSYAKTANPDFLIVPQNGLELVSANGQEDGAPETNYLNAIDANGQEDLFYGYDKDDKATPSSTTAYLKAFLKISKNAGNVMLVTDYCSTHSKMDDSYTKNKSEGFISFAADHRELDNIPAYPKPLNGENDSVISSISQVKNFLYLINTSNYSSKSAFIADVTKTNYDLLIMDLFDNNGVAFTASEINQLKAKANGGKRLIICYMSIGEAENYRYYWKSDWKPGNPSFLDKENPNWGGNYKVKYWDKEWQKIIYGNDDSYLKKILDAGFDGVYLDIIDAFEYYE